MNTMTHYKHLRVLVFGSAVLLLAAVSAFAKSSKTFNLPYAGLLAGSRIEAGRYQVMWEEHSPQVTVTVAREGGRKFVATAQGKIEERNTKYSRNMVVYSTRPDGTQVISELRLGGSSKAIVFGE
jgi:hypothetical protein